MKGSIVSAGEGNQNAARDAKCAAQLILDGWLRGGKVSKPTAKRRFRRFAGDKSKKRIVPPRKLISQARTNNGTLTAELPVDLWVHGLAATG